MSVPRGAGPTKTTRNVNKKVVQFSVQKSFKIAVEIKKELVGVDISMKNRRARLEFAYEHVTQWVQHCVGNVMVWACYSG